MIETNHHPRLSICIVTLNAQGYLHGCLASIAACPPKMSYEIIVVDNASTDNTLGMLRSEFPAVRQICNPRNEGFGKPMNQALRVARGDFLLVLNPDTLIESGALDLLVQFLASHTEVGICGPKVLNRDGSLQKACRRGVSRPWATFSYFSGLSRLFPRSKLFGGYLLNYLDEDATSEVDGVAGSCMLIRRAVIEDIGFFDEQFFAYQEDADYCFQAKKIGWKIMYYPAARVTHFGGQGGSRQEPFRSIFEWHRSYFLYYRKNLAGDYLFLFNWFYYLLMGLKLTLALSANALRGDRYAGPKRG